MHVFAGIAFIKFNDPKKVFKHPLKGIFPLFLLKATMADWVCHSSCYPPAPSLAPQNYIKHLLIARQNAKCGRNK